MNDVFYILNDITKLFDIKRRTVLKLIHRIS